MLDGVDSFAFTATGTFEVGDVETAAEFFACGIDNGKNNEPPVDYFHVEVTSGGTYATGDRVADNSLDGGNIHFHDPIVDPTPPPGGGAAVGADTDVLLQWETAEGPRARRARARTSSAPPCSW